MSEDLTPRERLRDRASRAMVTDAFFRWESAATIALTMLLTIFLPTLPPPFAWWQWWMWLAAGGIAEAALVIAHLTDPQSAHEAVARLFQEEYDPKDIKNLVNRRRLKRALEYRQSMADLAAEQSGAMRTSLQSTVDEIDDWVAQIHRLARRMDAFDDNALLENDLRTVPIDLRNLRRKLDQEDSPTVRNELEDAIKIKEQQHRHLQSAYDNMKRAEIQLENTLAALGTLYAQVQVIDSKDLDSARAIRLRDEIHDEIAGLEDTILAMDDVYASNRLVG